MATLTWIGGTPPTDWTNTNDWADGTITPAGPPGAGDTALVGQLSLETSLFDMTVNFEKPTDSSTIDATSVDLGANLKFFVTNPFDNAGSVTWRVIDTGTLDATNPNHDPSPQAGAMDLSAGSLTIDLAPSATFFDQGSIGGVGLVIAADSTGTFENDSTIDITGSFQLRSGAALTGAGVVNLQGNQAGGDITGSVGSGQTFAFVGQTNPGVLDGVLFLENPATFLGTVVLSEENEITLLGVNSGLSSYTGGVLTLDNGYTLHVTLGPGANSLLVQPSGGETSIFASAACFADGTRIATPRGETPIEDLRPGDRVTLARGGSAPVVWCGQRLVHCARHPRPREVWPIRVRAGAFGPGRPARDLVLSPDHAVFVDGVLVPVRHLLNGSAIAQERVGAVTYRHIELARHEVVLAEGLPAETYLDTGNRAAFGDVGAAPRVGEQAHAASG
jgi:hypothetical protein